MDDLAAVLACAGADVDDVIGRLDGRFVVLDDDQRIADVAEADERLDQPVVVALMQADGGLVEDVEHADEPAADLRREPDPLRLAAGQRRRRSLERQIVEPDVDQEPESRCDLLDDAVADQVLPIAPLERSDELVGLGDRHATQLGDVHSRRR